MILWGQNHGLDNGTAGQNEEKKPETDEPNPGKRLGSGSAVRAWV